MPIPPPFPFADQLFFFLKRMFKRHTPARFPNLTPGRCRSTLAGLESFFFYFFLRFVLSAFMFSSFLLGRGGDLFQPCLRSLALFSLPFPCGPVPQLSPPLLCGDVLLRGLRLLSSNAFRVQPDGPLRATRAPNCFPLPSTDFGAFSLEHFCEVFRSLRHHDPSQRRDADVLAFFVFFSPATCTASAIPSPIYTGPLPLHPRRLYGGLGFLLFLFKRFFYTVV